MTGINPSSGRPIIGLPKPRNHSPSTSSNSEEGNSLSAVSNSPTGNTLAAPEDHLPHEVSEAGAKFAPCDVMPVPDSQRDVEASAAGGGALADTATNSGDLTRLQLAMQRCAALSNKQGPMSNEKWGKRAAPILAASLNFLNAYASSSKEEQQARRRALKARSGFSREPNIDNLPVIAVYMCVFCDTKARTKAQRKEWCRFATVVKVANLQAVAPEAAGLWLENKTLRGILAEWRAYKNATSEHDRKPAVSKALQQFTHLAAALRSGSKFEAVAKAELSKVDAFIEDLMADTSSSLASPEPSEGVDRSGTNA